MGQGTCRKAPVALVGSGVGLGMGVSVGGAVVAAGAVVAVGSTTGSVGVAVGWPQLANSNAKATTESMILDFIVLSP
jgi:acyl-CoA hydrolase